jgi:hypothetical protein
LAKKGTASCEFLGVLSGGIDSENYEDSHSLGFICFFRENEWDEELRLALYPLFAELR